MRTTTHVIQSHLNKRLAEDLEGDIRENYAEDVVLLSSFGAFNGHDGVRASAARLKEQLGESIFEYKHTQLEGNFGFLEWTAHSTTNDVTDGADSFVVQDGLIALQTIHYSPTRGRDPHHQGGQSDRESG